MSFDFKLPFNVKMITHMSQPLLFLLQNIIPTEHRWKIELFKNWDAIIGDMRDKVIIQEIKDSVLILAVSHPAWAHELFLLTPLLKQKINSYLANEHIKAIRLRVKTFGPLVQRGKQIKKTLPMPYLNMQPSQQEQAFLKRVANHELRDALAKFLLRCKNQTWEKS